jgi:hypothetical protein
MVEYIHGIGLCLKALDLLIASPTKISSVLYIVIISLIGCRHEAPPQGFPWTGESLLPGHETLGCLQPALLDPEQHRQPAK